MFGKWLAMRMVSMPSSPTLTAASGSGSTGDGTRTLNWVLSMITPMRVWP